MAETEKKEEDLEEEAEEEKTEEPEEERDEDEDDPEVSLTQLIDRNRFLIEGLKQQLDRAKKRMMEGPEDEA